jgi:general secretion pathway protein M
MTTDYSMHRIFTRYPYAAVAVYAVAVVVLLATIWVSLADLYRVRAALADSRDILGKLEARQHSADAANTPAGAVPAGSPFIGGETITVAGAALLQRVAGAITRFGGTVQSSQVDVLGPRAKDGFVTLIISGEMEQPDLQKLLYDLEAGMPYMFLDQLVVQAPRTTVVAGGARMQMLIAVSGQWKGAK